MIEKTIDSKVIFNGKFINLQVDTVKLPDGKESGREVVIHPGAAVVAALTEQDEILLIRQFRYPVGEVLWELPAGKLEKNEEPLECAKRELAEETGYGAREWRYISDFFTTPGFSNEVLYLYLASGLYPEKREADSEEFIELHKVPYSKAVSMISSGEIKDAKTIIGILLIGQHEQIMRINI